ncbi:hypothetical protein [Pontibacter populi]|uniref:DUF4293 family protein n=1 Tax=Pontibacter populi TaxID=890055 RepID=A0ABV1RTU0_9BACT
MKSLITERLAINGLLLILSLFVLLHLLILFGIIPFEMVWGGRIKNQEEMVRLELVSIVANLLMLAIVAVRAGLLRIRLSYTFMRVVFWLMSGLFLLNTVGNILSTNDFERFVFTPVTIILTMLCLRLAISSEQKATA